MEELKVEDICNSDEFLDAVDEFTFFDCITNATESEEESVGSSKLSHLDSLEHQSHEDLSSKGLHKSEPTFPDGLRRRSSFRLKQRGVSGDRLKDSNSNSPLISETSHVCEGDSPRERRSKTFRALNDQEKVCEKKSDFSPFRLSSDEISGETKQNVESSILTSANQNKSDPSPFRLSSDEISGETKQNVESSSITSANQGSPAGELDNSSSSFLIFAAELVIKAISFQLNIFVKFFTFPVLVLYFSFLFVTNPCRTLHRVKRSIIEKLLSTSSVIYESVSPYLNEHFKGQKSIGNLAVKFGWGFFWSVYVGLVLFGFLMAGFVVGGLMIRYVVEEPLQMTGDLNFDYTRPSPVALVPIISCPSVSCGVKCREKVEVGKYAGSHVIPPNHKLQLTVSLTLPESEYNKNLGIFQVRAELLSSNGRVLGSSKHPCMLRFKSQPITYLETFLKSVPLLAGYSSEAQVLNLNMRGFTEGYEPTSCIRVILEQRAEYRPAAGIPEIYSASLVLKSELPFYKRILWYWKKTIFIWISMTLFFMELVLVLICCRPIIIPRSRPSHGPTGNDGPQNAITQVQGS